MFSCSLCLKKFSRTSSVNRHKLLHFGSKPFACSACAKTFSQKGHLNRHLKLHSAEQPFCCNYCEKLFSRKDKFYLHLKRHSCTKPFVCRRCSKAYSRKSSLTRHLSMHIGSKPFNCLLCLKKFRRRDNYERHVQSQHQQTQSIDTRRSLTRANIFGVGAVDNLSLQNPNVPNIIEEKVLFKPNFEYFECKKGLQFMALFDDFKDGRAFKNVKGDYAVLTRRNRESRAKKFGDNTNFFDCEIVL